MTTTTPLHEKTFPADEKTKLPRAFILRRLHSLLGIWLVIYLCEHLLVNSMSGLFFEDDGEGFISRVNQIHQLPYLPAIEILFLGIPFLIHGIWGVLYLRTARYNSSKSDGTTPALPQFKRNHAYAWQRITSWALVIGIVAHVIHMRFIDYPELVHRGANRTYFVRLDFDTGLYAIVHKLNAQLYNRQQIEEKGVQVKKEEERLTQLSPSQENYYFLKDDIEEDRQWLQAATKKPLGEKHILATAPNAGIAFLLILRDVFKSPAMVILYSILVIAASYHAFNGLWTFLITWGVTLTRRSQKNMRRASIVFMVIVTFLGLMAAWGTYFTTQR